MKDTCTKLLALAKAATPGSWEVQCDPVHGDWIAAGGTWLTSGRFYGPDANFIAAANPEIISALCERILKLEDVASSARRVLMITSIKGNPERELQDALASLEKDERK